MKKFHYFQKKPASIFFRKNSLLSFVFFINICVVLLFSLTYTIGFAYVAKINDDEISVEEFQTFVDFQKFIAKEKNLKDLLETKSIDIKEILKDYINMQILLKEAKKKNYANNPAVLKTFKNTREEWLISLYVNRQIDLINEAPNVDSLKKEYSKFPIASERKFEDLSNDEKQRLYQISVMRSIQGKKEEYRKKLEKKYKVKYNYSGKKTLARFNNVSITRAEMEERLGEELEKLGLSYKELAEKDKAKAEQIKVDMIHELVFRKLSLAEIKASKFVQKKEVIDGLRFYNYQVRIEEYVKNEIVSKIPISSDELDEAFVSLSRENPNIQKMLPTEQEKVLRSAIIQQKLPKAMNDLLIERKEEAVIKRDYDKLQEII